MKRLAVALMVLLLASCVSVGNPKSVAVLAGCFEFQDQSTYTTSQLRLHKNGTFQANVQGDVGSWGNTTGRWSLQSSKVFLQPSGKSKSLSIPRELTVQRYFGKYQLASSHGEIVFSSVKCYDTFGHANGL